MKNYLINKIRIIIFLILYVINIRPRASSADNFSGVIYKKNLNVNRNIPKNIWIFWDSDTENYLVDNCISKIKKIHNDYNVYVVNFENIQKFITIDLNQYDHLIQHKSDLIRLLLLHKYGGVWVDASTMVFEKFDFYIKQMENLDVDFFAFYLDCHTYDYNYPIFENWFMISSPNNIFVFEWIKNLKFALKMSPIEYYNYISENNPDCLQNIKDPYLMTYLSAQKAMRSVDTNYLFVDCQKNSFLYVDTGGIRYIFKKKKYKRSYTHLINNLILFKMPKNMPNLIKVTRKDRDSINFFYKLGFYKKKSMLDYFDSL